MLTRPGQAWSQIIVLIKIPEQPAVINNVIISALVNSAQWITSSVSLGDSSAHVFVSPIKSAFISNVSGEGFSAIISKETRGGIVVYRVDELPNTISVINAKWNSDKYFGVFITKVNPSLPVYTAVYSLMMVNLHITK